MDDFSLFFRTERRNRDIFSYLSRTERRNRAGTSVRRNGRYLGQSSSQNLEGADYISCLPESVLLHILSFLDTNDAVKTGILSSQWKSLWTFTPNLIFNGEEIGLVPFLDIDRMRLMVDFVDRTLSLYKRDSIHKFQLCLPYSEKYVSRFEEWILFATERNVEELIVETIAHDRFDFYGSPPWLFENQLLGVLELRSLEINLPVQVHMSSLKTLSLSELKLNNSIVNQLMAGCPLIEDFRLLYCAIDDCICISSPTLQRVSLRLAYDYNLEFTHNSQGFEVDAPNLLSINVSSCMCMNKYRLKNCFSIQETDINLFATSSCRHYFDNIGHQSKLLLQFMKDLSPAKVLRLSKSTVQVLSTEGMKYLPAPINGCKCLKFTTGLAEVEFSLIGKLLTSSPDLDTLMIDVNHHRDKNIDYLLFPPVYEVFDEASLKDFYCRCLEGVRHVKTVIISGLLRRNGIEKVNRNVSLLRGWLKSELYLVKFLLQNATVLEELTIRITDKKYFKMLQPSKIETLILALPRASPNAQVSILS